jgi:hypothetical protein
VVVVVVVGGGGRGAVEGGVLGSVGAGFDGVVVVGDTVEVGCDGGEHFVTPLAAFELTADGRFPSITPMFLSVRLELAAHRQRLQESEPLATMVDPLPFTVTGLVAMGKPPAPGSAPPVVTAYVHPAVRVTVPPPLPFALVMAAARPDAPPSGPEQGTSSAALAYAVPGELITADDNPHNRPATTTTTSDRDAARPV